MTHAKSHPDHPTPKLPPNFGWIRISIGIVAVGYALVAIALYLIRRDLTLILLIDAVTAVLSAGAFLVFAKWPRPSGLFVISLVWIQLTNNLYILAAPEVTSILVYPALMLPLGLMLGERWSIAGAFITVVAIPLAVFGGRQAQGITTDTAGTVVSIVIIEIVMVCSGFFARTILASFRRLLAGSEQLRKRYSRLFQDMPDGLLETDPTGRIVEANAVAERLLAPGGNPLAGQLLAEVLARAAIGPTFVPGDIRPGHPLVLQAGASRYEVSAGTPPDAPGSALLVVRDVTARQQIMERQALMQRLDTVGQLAGGIAHEFNNLLTAIGGNAGLLKTHPDGDVQRFAAQIMIAQERAASMTRQMTAFARHDLHQPEVISLGRELNEWEGLLRHLLGEHCRLDIKGGGSSWVEVDQVHVEQILVNLVTNARDASPQGGRIEIRLSRLLRAEAGRLGSTLEAGSQVLLEVIDQGHGMSPEVKRRLFEPFFTTKPPGQGPGLGLAAVHGLVAQNHGAIEITSEVGVGTTVRLFFPEVSAGSRPSSVNPLPAATLSRRHVLLVDDDATACRTAVFALEQAGFAVTVIDTGFEAVRFFRQSPTEIDLVITSVVLPVLTGRELIERLRKLHPVLPALYVCGRFDLPAGWPADEKNFPLLMKPFRAEDLLKRVEALLPA